MSLKTLKQLEILCIGDIHVKTKNFTDVDILLKELEDHLQKNHYDAIFSMGDTLDTHKRLDSDCLNKATQYFLMLEKYAQVFLIVGNHDLINNSQYLTDKHWLNGFKHTKHRFTVVDTVVDVNINGFRIVAVPYVPDGMFHKALCEKLGDDYWCSNKKVKDESNPIDLILAHQMFNDVSLGGIDKFVNAEYWDKDIQIVSGHIHNRQVLKKIYYTGSSLQHSFGETEDKTVAHVILSRELRNEENKSENDKKNENKSDKSNTKNTENTKNTLKIEIKEIAFNLPIRKMVYTDISEIEETLNELDVDNPLLKFKVSIKGDPNEYKSFIKTKSYREYEKKGIKFDFKGEFKDEILKQMKKLNIDEKEMTKHMDFFSLFDHNISTTKDTDLSNFHNKMKKKLPTRSIVNEGSSKKSVDKEIVDKESVDKESKKKESKKNRNKDEKLKNNKNEDVLEI